MTLPDSERALLAVHLLGSLPSILADEGEGIAEALRRDAELDANPHLGLTLEQLARQIGTPPDLRLPSRRQNSN